MAGGAQTSGEGLGSHSGDIAAMTTHMRVLASDHSPEAVQHLIKDIQRGLPPVALVALLESLRTSPRGDLTGIVLKLSSHRRPAVRGYACQVLIAQGSPWARGAILVAIEDHDLRVRKIGYEAIERSPRHDYQWPLFRLVKRGETAAVDALIASSTQEILPYLEAEEVLPAASLARLLGGLLARDGFGQEPRRLAMVSALANNETPASQNELWVFAHADLNEKQPGPQILARQIIVSRTGDESLFDE